MAGVTILTVLIYDDRALLLIYILILVVTLVGSITIDISKYTISGSTLGNTNGIEIRVHS